ncbi:GNAT family N-acetyltransferase [Streptomyces kanamyceticus]|uniref:GNAT family N-acetyltransferase n=1 Tax=Streptomyces kanamyceticus TaxID=1967 RepID=A0A5J6GCB6_STRKN|nr:GNAT family N-acetyltransferase [Streptomyces kanamyceticus]QEU93490.1 GNAT family N-acetyltransferase [Streptomyces kanamyceticus]
MDAGLIRSWVEGWVVSRGAAVPVVEPWGFTVDVGLSGHVTRHVMADADEPLVRKLTETVTAPGTWLKVFLPRETVAPWVAPGWRFGDDGFLMSAPLRPTAAAAPEGYEIRTWTRGGVTRVLVLGRDGAFAAHGQVAVPGPGRTAVFDQIETSEAHRRKGLGSLVMRTLGNVAAAEGSSAAVLGATDEGRALYEFLGWRTHGPLTSLVREAPAARGA